MGRKSRAKWERRRQESRKASLSDSTILKRMRERAYRQEALKFFSRELTASGLCFALGELDDDAMVRILLPVEPGERVDQDEDRVITDVHVVSDQLVELHGDFPDGWPIEQDSELGKQILRENEEAGEPPPDPTDWFCYAPDDELTAGELIDRLDGLDQDAAVRVLLPPDVGDPVDPDEHWAPVQFETKHESLGYLWCDFPRPYSLA